MRRRASAKARPSPSAAQHSATVATVVHIGHTGDSHRMVELLTQEHGRLTAIARGARASKKRFAGILDLFATLSVQLQHSGAGWSLVAADACKLRLGIRRNLDAIVRASMFCQCVRSLAAPQQQASHLLDLLNEALDVLDGGGVADSAHYYPRLLAVAGLLPERYCHVCGGADDDVRLGLAPAEGSLVCLGCRPATRALSGEALAVLSMRSGPALAESVAREVEACVMLMIGVHQGKALTLPQLVG